MERHQGAHKSLSFLTFRRSRIIIYFLFSFIILEKCCRRIKTSLLVFVGQMIFRIIKVAWNRFNESHLTFICLLNAAWNTHTKSIFDCRNKCTGFCTRVPIPARSLSPTAKCGTGGLIQYLCHFSLHSVGYNYVMRLHVCGHYPCKPHMYCICCCLLMLLFGAWLKLICTQHPAFLETEIYPVITNYVLFCIKYNAHNNW